MKNKNRIESVRIDTVVDDSPDTSWLGEYSNDPKGEFAIDREERGDMERGEFRYFNPGSVEPFNPAATWIPATIQTEVGRRAYWHEAMQSNAEQDYKRSESYNRGDFCFVGIVAKAVVVSTGGIVQTLRSGGLWGIESDSGADHIASVEQEELSGLRSELEAFGFGSRSVSYAFRNVSRKSCL